MQNDTSLDKIINDLEYEIYNNEKRKQRNNYILYAILNTIMIIVYVITGTLLIMCSIKMNLDSMIYRIPLFIIGTLAIITGIITSIRAFLFLSGEF